MDRDESLSDEANLERLLYKARHQLNAIAGIARDSTGSLDTLLRAMQARESKGKCTTFVTGSGPDGLFMWKDVAMYLPPLEDCEELIRFYFEDLSIYIRINQRSLIDKYWHKLLEGQGLERNKLAVLCTIMAMADGTAPPNSNVRKHTMQDHDRWVKLAGDPLVTPFEEQVDNSFERVMTLGLLAIYNLYMGRHDRLWECMGAAVRKGYIIGLFDERHKSWHGISNIDKEYRRRLAWYMLSLERIQAFMRLLPFALHPDYVYLALPSFESDSLVMQGRIQPARIMPTYPMTLPDGRLQTHMSANDGRVVKFVIIELMAVCLDFLSRFNSMTPPQRYSRASQLDDLLERTLVDGLTGTGIDLHDLHYLRFLTSQTLDTCPKEKQLGVNLWVSTIFFLRCIITRRFLTDENAPPSLRFISLTFAQGIISTIPSLTRIVKEGIIPIQMTWNANHLLCAATAFAVVILGHDPYAGIDSDPVRALKGASRRSIFPQEQVRWLADNIFSTLECLEMLVERGNAAALTAKRLLDRLCGSQDELRSLYRQRFSSYADNEALRTPTLSVRMRDSIPPSFESPHNGNSWSRSPSAAQSRSTPPPSGAPTPPVPSSGTTNGCHRPLPPIQPYPPARQQPNMPLVGRFTNASSLLDAVLMEPPDLSFMVQSNTGDLLDSLLQVPPQHLATGAA